MPGLHRRAAAAVDEAELGRRLSLLTLEQKVRLLTGAGLWSLHAEPAIGLRPIVTSDGPAGVRGERWDERSPSANIPSPTALAATWDETRVERIGRLLASEARRKGVDVLLAPTVNLHRTPYGGRHFECLSEDPLLTAGIGGALVRGLQAEGVAATVKHFVANDSETERFTVDVVLDERPLRELYLAPFEAIVRDAGAWAVMAAYNSLHGHTMTESPLLGEILKDEWQFDGAVISDWHAARSTRAAAAGRLDIAMPGPDGPWGDALVAAVRKGEIPESAIDEHAARILRLAARVGALEGLPASAGPAVRWTDTEISAELRSCAAAGFVLASNPGGLLPLAAASLREVAVLGPNAALARTLGGGSATVFAPYVVSPLDGLRAALGGVAVTHAVGCTASDRVPVAPAGSLRLPDDSGAGVEVRLLAADGRELHRERRASASWLWWGPITHEVTAADVGGVEVRTRLRPEVDGVHRVGVSGLGEVTLSIDGVERLETTIVSAPGDDVVEGMTRPPQAYVELTLSYGQDVDVRLSLRRNPEPALGNADGGMLALQLNFAPRFDAEAEFAKAVGLAARADVAVVIVGTSEEVESEGFDRADLKLPGRQDALVDAVASANPRTVVVVNSGAPVLLPWADRVAAVVLAWFPGQEFGHALADVLLGDAEPGGRLPTTWPESPAGLPPVTPVEASLRYEEGLFVGYRSWDRDGRVPRFAFGHGLGYTEWAYEGLTAPAVAPPGEEITVTVRVANAGRRGGREVVQIYASKPETTIERPPQWLVGSAVVEAAAGATSIAEVVLPARALEHWDGSAWRTEPGIFTLRAGRSSRDLRVRGEVVIAAAPG